MTFALIGWGAVVTGCVWLRAKSPVGNDGFTDRGVNTFNNLPKTKSVQTDHTQHGDAAAFASIWDLYDTYSALQGACIVLNLIGNLISKMAVEV